MKFGYEKPKNIIFSQYIGKVPKDADIKSMIEEAPGPINFTMLLTLFGDRLNGTDEESVILNAFKLYDSDASGFVSSKALRETLCCEGKPDERLTDAEFNKMLEGAPVDSKGHLDYTAFTRIIKRGKQDDE